MREDVNMPSVGYSQAKVGLYRAIIIGAVALALISGSFHGILDEFAQEEVADTTKESMGIFVVTRAINGGVSVFQTSQVNVPLLASVEVGQMLDPVNDAVERLSSTLVWAIGSLFVQRILLEMVAGPVFKWAFCWIGVGAIAFLLLMEWRRFRIRVRHVFGVSDNTLERFRDWLVRLLIVAVIFRFIIPVFIALSFLFSQLFLESAIAENSEQLSVLRTQVSDIAGSPTRDSGELEDEKSELEKGIDELENSVASAREEMEQLDARIEKLGKGEGPWRLLPTWLGGASDSEELGTAKKQRQDNRS